jgi:hypothetical protein
VATTTVFLVWHNHGPIEDSDNAKLLGVFSSRELAQERVEAALTEPGFADHPEGFTVDEYVVDQHEWIEGFVEFDTERWVDEGLDSALPTKGRLRSDPGPPAGP